MDFDIFENICKKKNTTPTALAKKLGLSNAITTHWKNGASPSADVVRKLADELECSADYLLGRDDYIRTELSENDREMLLILHKFNEREQIKFIGRAEQMANEILKGKK